VFGVGLQEMVVIAFVAMLVFGPDRLFAHAARDELRTELGPEYSDLQLRDLDPRTIVRKHIMEAMNEPADDDRPRSRPLRADETPPFDLDAT